MNISNTFTQLWRFRHFSVPFIILLIVIINLSCDDGPPAADANQIVFPETNVKFGTHVQPLFDRACAFPGTCHGADTYDEHGFTLDSYSGLFPGAARQMVFPGDPSHSPLILSIEGNYQSQPRMPLNLAPLNDNQIRGLKRWIAEGAHNN